MSELLNYNEIAVAVAGALVTDDHAALLDALHARYPSAGFRFVAEREGRTWQPGIVERESNRVSDSLSVIRNFWRLEAMPGRYDAGTKTPDCKERVVGSPAVGGATTFCKRGL